MTPTPKGKVVKEYSLFLRPETNVNLLRLPVSIPSRKIHTIRVKPKSNVVEVDTKPSRGSSEVNTFKSRRLLGRNSMAIGLVKENSIYLTQLSNCYEFKLNLDRINTIPTKSGSKSKSKDTDSADVDVDEEEEPQPSTSREETSTARPITMRFATAFEDDKKRQRESSYHSFVERIESEPFTVLDFVDNGSEKSNEIVENMSTVTS